MEACHHVMCVCILNNYVVKEDASKCGQWLTLFDTSYNFMNCDYDYELCYYTDFLLEFTQKQLKVYENYAVVNVDRLLSVCI